MRYLQDERAGQFAKLPAAAEGFGEPRHVDHVDRWVPQPGEQVPQATDGAADAGFVGFLRVVSRAV